MRRIILTTALVALAPFAYAQPNTGPMGGTDAGRAGPVVTNWVTRAPDPENCGTPDEPRPCPPMPRHPLPYFPGSRQQP
jgi:hypothetical protein